MGVVNTKATAIGNADQQFPQIHSSPFLTKGDVYSAVGTVAVATTDSSTSVYRFARIPSGARLHRLDIFSDAITGFTSAKVGVYKPQDSAGTAGVAVSDNLFGATIDLSVAQTEPYDVIFNNLGIANIEKRMWELLALTSDPMVMYDICITGVTMASGSGNLAMRLEYTI